MVHGSDKKNKLLYYKYAIEGTNNKVLKEIMEKESRSKTKWYRSVEKYLEELNINREDVIMKSKMELKRIINNWDTIEWRRKIVMKVTLSTYRIIKNDVKEEKWFYNARKCNIMMKARSNTLNLGWRSFGTEEEKRCKLCNA